MPSLDKEKGIFLYVLLLQQPLSLKQVSLKTYFGNDLFFQKNLGFKHDPILK